MLASSASLHPASRTVTPASAALADTSRVAGIWQGTLMGSLRLVFKVSRAPDGTHTATMDSPDQGALGIPVTSVVVTGDSVRFAVTSIGGGYHGKFASDQQTLAGEWRQMGAVLPLELKRVESAPELPRPQHPRPPYPYRALEVSFESVPGAVKLAGTLTVPETTGRHACAVLLTGSGSEDRDETIFGHKPFLVIADHLTRQGLAVLRLDDRGIGGSTGDPATATTQDFAHDASAAVDFLRGRPEIDPKRIGFIGHSEGGLIATLAANRRHDVAFVIMLAGPGIPGDSTLVLQSAAMRRGAGASEDQIARERPLLLKLIAAVKQGADSVAVRAAAEALVSAQLEGLPAAPDSAGRAQLVRTLARQIRSPWFQFFMGYDPRPALARLRCPTLALNGGRDLQVLPKENLAAIESAVRSGGNRDVTVRELPGLNHLFQTARTGSMMEYGVIEETFAPAALAAMSDWLRERRLTARK